MWRSRVGRVMRDVERPLDAVPDCRRAALQALIDRTKRILSQKPKPKPGAPYNGRPLAEALEQAAIPCDVTTEAAHRSGILCLALSGGTHGRILRKPTAQLNGQVTRTHTATLTR